VARVPALSAGSRKFVTTGRKDKPPCPEGTSAFSGWQENAMKKGMAVRMSLGMVLQGIICVSGWG
jgi:hypothetical protein